MHNTEVNKILSFGRVTWVAKKKEEKIYVAHMRFPRPVLEGILRVRTSDERLKIFNANWEYGNHVLLYAIKAYAGVEI